MVAGLVVGALIARHLGAHDYGVLSFGIAVTGLLSLIQHLGLDTTLIRDLVRAPQLRPTILGTHFTLRVGGGALLFLLTQLALLAFNNSGRIVHVTATLIASAYWWRALDVLELAQHAEGNVRGPTGLRMLAFLFTTAFRIALLVAAAPVWAFAAAFIVENALVASLLWIRYRSSGHEVRIALPDPTYLRELRSEIGFAFGAAVCTTLLLRFDQVWLGKSLGPAALGPYAAAVRLVEAMQVLATSLIVAATPAILRAAVTSEPELFRVTVANYRRILVYGLVTGGATLFCAPFIVSILYGPEFAQSQHFLRIYVWMLPFMGIVLVNSRWLYARNLARWNFVLLSIGAVIHMAVALALIPVWGASGALTAVLAGVIMPSCIVPLFFPATRPLGKLLWISISGGKDESLG